MVNGVYFGTATSVSQSIKNLIPSISNLSFKKVFMKDYSHLPLNISGSNLEGSED